MSTVTQRRRTLLAALMTTSILSLCAAAGSATQLSLSEDGFRAAWTPMRFVAGPLSISCDLTLEGRLHSRSIGKVEGALVGSVSSASVGSCTGGSATVLAETLPWHVQYGSFTGSLPDIGSVTLRLVGASVRVAFGELTHVPCSGTTEANAPATVIANLDEAGTLTSMRLGEAAGIPLTGNIVCSLVSRGTLAGSSTSVTTPSGGAISVSLLRER